MVMLMLMLMTMYLFQTQNGQYGRYIMEQEADKFIGSEVSISFLAHVVRNLHAVQFRSSLAWF